jgi:predicted DNA-binding protein
MLTPRLVTMYTYIVERTQIYLSREQSEALDREARRLGTTRSHLIREAIDQTYLAGPDRERIRAGLRRSAGAWAGRTETGEEYVERIRGTGRLSRLWAGRDDEDAREGAEATDPGPE